ncbi:carbohydrate-binding protein [Paenibacillus sp. B2(2019)]|nr:carbohydrate-binding protein [Paenibacillus sp. B2(2019)]
MEYKINITTSGIYKVNYRVAVSKGTGEVQFTIDGVNKKTTSFPATEGFQSWKTISDTVSLEAGTQTLRLVVTKGGWNLSWFDLVNEADRKLNSILSPPSF